MPRKDIVETVIVIAVVLFQLAAFIVGGFLFYNPDLHVHFPWWFAGYAFISCWVLIMSIILLPIILLLEKFGINPTAGRFHDNKNRKD